MRTGGLAALAALAVHSAVDFNLRIPSNALLFVSLAALASGPWDAASAVPRARPQTATTWRTGIAAGVLAVAAIVALSVPWVEARVDTAKIIRAGGVAAGVRRSALLQDVSRHLRRRPTDATAWVVLAWLKAPYSAEEAVSVAAWAVRLDPGNDALRSACARIR